MKRVISSQRGTTMCKTRHWIYFIWSKDAYGNVDASSYDKCSGILTRHWKSLILRQRVGSPQSFRLTWAGRTLYWVNTPSIGAPRPVARISAVISPAMWSTLKLAQTRSPFFQPWTSAPTSIISPAASEPGTTFSLTLSSNLVTCYECEGIWLPNGILPSRNHQITVLQRNSIDLHKDVILLQRRNLGLFEGQGLDASILKQG